MRGPVPRKAEVGRDESCRCRWFRRIYFFCLLMRFGSRFRFAVRDWSRMIIIIDKSLFQNMVLLDKIHLLEKVGISESITRRLSPLLEDVMF